MTVRWLITWYNLDPETLFPPLLFLQTIIIRGRCHFQTFRIQQIAFISGPGWVYRVRWSFTMRRHLRQEWLNSNPLTQEWLKTGVNKLLNSFTSNPKTLRSGSKSSDWVHINIIYSCLIPLRFHSFSWSKDKSLPFTESNSSLNLKQTQTSATWLFPQAVKFNPRELQLSSNIILHLLFG